MSGVLDSSGILPVVSRSSHTLAVPSSNLDVVQSIFADWERGDFKRSDWADPEIEYMHADGPEPGVWSGRTGMAEAARWMWSTIEDGRVESDEYHELDAERVVVSHYGGRGMTSGLDLGQTHAKAAHLFHVHDGKVTRLVFYWDRDHALADLGPHAGGAA
jgi:ketosteroid isomerase-like protein